MGSFLKKSAGFFSFFIISAGFFISCSQSTADIKTGEDKIEINNAKDENQYSIDGKNWISPVEGKVLFENLDPDKEYTVYTRVAATDEAPSSVSSEGVKVKTYKMLGYCNVEVEGSFDEFVSRLVFKKCNVRIS